MHFRKLVSSAVIVALGIFPVVCAAGKPIQNVENQAIVTDSAVSMEQVENAIIRGGATRNWKMRTTEPGHIVGTLDIRSHQAVVDIFFSTETYSILYKDSENLDYKDGKIHRNYNKWIANLNGDIQQQLAR